MVLGGLEIYYTEWGRPSAPPVLLLHGLNVQSHTWDPIARRLADDYHVIAMDMRGHGESGWAQSGYRVRSMARDVHALVDELGVGPVSLVGHSAGARVAISVAGEAPATVSRLALSDAGPQTTQEGAIAMVEFIQSTTAIKGFRSEQDARDHYMQQHPEWEEEFIDLHVRYQVRRNWAGKLVLKADPDVQWVTGSVSLPDVEYLWSMAERLDMPTLLMVGRHSNILDDDLVERMRSTMPGATVAWFDTGHYVPREQPEQFTKVLANFLEGDR